MATFSVDDIIRKTGGTQNYKIVEVPAIETVQKYKCKFDPSTMSQMVDFTFKETEIELAP